MLNPHEGLHCSKRHYHCEIVGGDTLHGLSGPENKRAAYLKMNPTGKAPLLVDGDFHVWE